MSPGVIKCCAFEKPCIRQEVTGLIMPVFDDYCTIRRLLVDEGLIRRDGASYWREGESGDCAGLLPWPAEETEKMGKRGKTSERSEIKRVYKQNSPAGGIYQIRNTANGRIYVGSSRNLDGDRNSRLFQLRMGKVVFSRELQKDLDQFGAGSFDFSVLEVLPKPGPGENGDQLLAALHLQWLEKLQPFGDRGYNSAKAFQREMERLGNLCGGQPLR